METKKFSNAVLPLVLCAVFMVLSRLSGILYSFFATDVLYQNSQFCYILQSLRQILHAVSVAFGAGAAFRTVINKHKATFPIVITSVVLLADSIAAVVYDIIRNVLKGRLIFGIGYRFTMFAYELIILLAGLYIASLLIRYKKSVSLAAIVAVAHSPIIDLVYVVWDCFESLIEMDFLPYTDEIYTMACETATVLIATLAAGAVGILIVKKYRCRKEISAAKK